MQAILGQSGRARARGLVSSVGLALGGLLSVGACGNTEVPSDTGGGGSTAQAGSNAAGAHSAGASGAAQTSQAGGGAAGESQTNDAGAAGEGQTNFAGAAGEAGTAGAPALGGASGGGGSAGAPATAPCTSGGTLFPSGNYADGQGNELWLRTNTHAATLALVPHGPAKNANPPQIFRVERVCSAGGALLAANVGSFYRVDFSLTGYTLAVCKSVAAASLDEALALAPADFTHALDTGCGGKPFSVFLPEVTP